MNDRIDDQPAESPDNNAPKTWHRPELETLSVPDRTMNTYDGYLSDTNTATIS